MQLSEFDFDLPEDRIALRPVEPRDAARLLHVTADGLSDLAVRDLPGLLRAGDILVFNDTRVIPARLSGTRRRGESVVAVDATLHRRLSEQSWTAYMKPGKRLKPGDRILFTTAHASDVDTPPELEATVLEKSDDGEVTLDFGVAGPALDAAIRSVGVMPIPPYIAQKRAYDAQDARDYQTVYARHDGSVAAPTAGLHFTPELLAALAKAGIGQAFVTLHVGAGTFMPVKTDRIEDHRMHSEFGQIDADTAARLNAARAAGGRIIAVGTTSARLLESAAGADGRISAFSAPTDIFIRPGYRFRAVDALMTNFHLPKSTLLMMLSALSGLDRVRRAYAHAVEAGYRFYSYGDAGLWWPESAE